MVDMMGSCTEYIVTDGELAGSTMMNIPSFFYLCWYREILTNLPEDLQIDEMIANIHPIQNFLLILN
jgi:hypothetical protein